MDIGFKLGILLEKHVKRKDIHRLNYVKVFVTLIRLEIRRRMFDGCIPSFSKFKWSILTYYSLCICKKALTFVFFHLQCYHGGKEKKQDMTLESYL